MKISLDLESTLADIRTPFKDEYERRNGFRPAESDQWDFDNSEFDLREFLEITGHNWKHNVNEIPVTEKGLMAKTHEIYELVNQLDVVTGRWGHKKTMRAWLNTKGILFDDFIVVPNQDKKAGLGYDIYIDDCPKHADFLDTSQRLFLYDQPYNQDVVESETIIRVNSLAEVLQQLESLHNYA